MTSSWVLRGLLLVVAGLTGGLLWSNQTPLGVPGEWVWSRRDRGAELGIAILFGFVVGALYCGWAWWGSRQMPAAGRVRRGTWIVGLFAATIALWGGLLSLIPGVSGIGRVPWVLYFPGSSGYFTQARRDVRETREFLRTYQQRVTEAEGMDRYLHLGTHPPGLTLAFHGLISICQQVPGLVRLVEATEPDLVHEAFAAIQATARPGAGMSGADRAALWLGWWLVVAGAALGGPAIYGLARRRAAPADAWRMAALWPLVPAVIIFLPKSDALFGGLAPALAWLWFRAVDRASWTRAMLFGSLLYGSLLLSLAFLPVALLIALATLFDLFLEAPVAAVPPAMANVPPGPSPTRSARLASTVFAVVWALAGFLIPAIGLWVWARYNSLGVALQNLRNHAEFYQHSPRSYAGWLGVNVAELGFAVGLPILVATLAGLFRPGMGRTAVRGHLFAFAVVWGILWLSGKNMGEAARLWCFLLAWPTFGTGGILAGPSDPAGRSSATDWVWLLGTQMLACVVTTFVVSGFDFGLVQ